MVLSVITVNRNNRTGLKKTVDSVMSQFRRNEIEYLVIDGQSDDGSVDILNASSDGIDWWVSEKDRGIYDAMNKGVLHSSGEYVLFLNSGDSFSSDNVVATVLDSLKDTGKSLPTIFIGKVNVVDSDANVVRTYGVDGMEFTPYGMLARSIPHQATIIPRSLLVNNPYDVKYPIVADWQFILRQVISGSCDIQVLPVVIADYDNTGVSSNYQKMLSEKKKALLESLPNGVRNDYQQLLPYVGDYYRIRWCMNHPHVIKVFRFITSILMKIGL